MIVSRQLCQTKATWTVKYNAYKSEHPSGKKCQVSAVRTNNLMKLFNKIISSVARKHSNCRGEISVHNLSDFLILFLFIRLQM
jgi:hypothetical protein